MRVLSVVHVLSSDIVYAVMIIVIIETYDVGSLGWVWF